MKRNILTGLMTIATVSIMSLGTIQEANAANCKVNLTVANKSNKHMGLLVQSRTRANATWRNMDGALFNNVWSFERVRKYGINPRGTHRGTVTFTLLGCKVKRKARIVYTCLDQSDRPYQRVSNLWGGKFTRPRDIRVNAPC